MRRHALGAPDSVAMDVHCAHRRHASCCATTRRRQGEICYWAAYAIEANRWARSI